MPVAQRRHTLVGRGVGTIVERRQKRAAISSYKLTVKLRIIAAIISAAAVTVSRRSPLGLA